MEEQRTAAASSNGKALSGKREHIAAVSIMRDGNGWRSTVTGRRGPARVEVRDYDRDKSVVLNCAAKRVMAFHLGPVEIQEVVA